MTRQVLLGAQHEHRVRSRGDETRQQGERVGEEERREHDDADRAERDGGCGHRADLLGEQRPQPSTERDPAEHPDDRADRARRARPATRPRRRAVDARSRGRGAARARVGVRRTSATRASSRPRSAPAARTTATADGADRSVPALATTAGRRRGITSSESCAAGSSPWARRRSRARPAVPEPARSRTSATFGPPPGSWNSSRWIAGMSR